MFQAIRYHDIPVILTPGTFIHRPIAWADKAWAALPQFRLTDAGNPYVALQYCVRNQRLYEPQIHRGYSGLVCFVEKFNGWSKDVIGLVAIRRHGNSIKAVPVYGNVDVYMQWRTTPKSLRGEFPFPYHRVEFKARLTDTNQYSYRSIPYANPDSTRNAS